MTKGCHTNLLDEVAQCNKLPRFMLNLVDETESNSVVPRLLPVDGLAGRFAGEICGPGQPADSHARPSGQGGLRGGGLQFLLPRMKSTRGANRLPEAFRLGTSKSGTISGCSKPSIRFTIPIVDAVISIAISSITISAIRTSSIL